MESAEELVYQLHIHKATYQHDLTGAEGLLCRILAQVCYCGATVAEKDLYLDLEVDMESKQLLMGAWPGAARRAAEMVVPAVSTAGTIAADTEEIVGLEASDSLVAVGDAELP